jgi:hypothetical protein
MGPKGPGRQAVRAPQPVHGQRGEELADSDTAAGMRHRRPRLGCPKLRLNRTDALIQYPPQRGGWKVMHQPSPIVTCLVAHTP